MLLAGYRHSPCGVFVPCSAVYTPKGFIPQAASLRQTFVHCGRFLTAASRRSGARVSVPLWPAILSDRLPVVALVSLYLTNKLMGRRPIRKRPKPFRHAPGGGSTSGISPGFPGLSPSSG